MEEEPFEVPAQAGVLPLVNAVLFPGGLLPLAVARSKTLALVDAASKGPLLVVISPRDPKTDDPTPEELFGVGTLSRVTRYDLTETGATVVVQGLARVRLVRQVSIEPYLVCELEALEASPQPEDPECTRLGEQIREGSVALLRATNDPVLPHAEALLRSLRQPGQVADLAAANLPFSIQDKQTLLETTDVQARLRRVLELLEPLLPETVPAARARLAKLAFPDQAEVLPLTEAMVFPDAVLPVRLFDPVLISMVERARRDQRPIVVGTRVEPSDHPATRADLFPVGTLSLVLWLWRDEKGAQVELYGGRRVSLGEAVRESPILEVRIRPLKETRVDAVEGTAKRALLATLARDVYAAQQAEETFEGVLRSKDPLEFADMLAATLPLPKIERQRLLATVSGKERLDALISLVRRMRDALGVGEPPVKKSFWRRLFGK
jgi:ATP-dependent Lon protease